MKTGFLVTHVCYIDLQEPGIGIINASAIGMGLLSNRGAPEWHPAQNDIKNACKQAAQYCQVIICV